MEGVHVMGVLQAREYRDGSPPVRSRGKAQELGDLVDTSSPEAEAKCEICVQFF